MAHFVKKHVSDIKIFLNVIEIEPYSNYMRTIKFEKNERRFDKWQNRLNWTNTYNFEQTELTAIWAPVGHG